MLSSEERTMMPSKVQTWDCLLAPIKRRLTREPLGCQLLSNYLVIPVVTVFCSQILVTLLTFDTVTGKISESKWKVTSK